MTIVARAPSVDTSATSQASPLALLQQILQPQAGGNAGMTAIKDYLNQGTQTAGDPNAQDPSVLSALLQGLTKTAGQADNSLLGQGLNSALDTTAQGPNTDGSAGQGLMGKGLSALLSLFA